MKNSEAVRTSGRDRRRDPRNRVEYWQCWLPVSGVIYNASVSGLAIETLKEAEIGEYLFIQAQIDGKSIAVPGHVRWSRRIAGLKSGDKVVPIYQIGIAIFEELSGHKWRKVVLELEQDKKNTNGGRRPRSEAPRIPA